MLRVLLLWAVGAGVLFGQSGLGPPLAGYARDSAGCLRPIFGVFGNLVAGEALACGVVAADFSGRVGLARTAEGRFAFDAAGRLLRRLPRAGRESARPPARSALTFEGEDLVLRREDTSELRLRVEGEVSAIERMNQDWFLVHQPSRRLVVRAAEDQLEVCVLPEPAR
ncbi:MAG: hypothetical protein IT159_16055 [Bryobacterales bacterium]|nr:hypothetical protein [Bryobacterales bacterium]